MSLFTDECLELLEQIDKWGTLDQKRQALELLRTKLCHIRRRAAKDWKHEVAHPPRR